MAGYSLHIGLNSVDPAHYQGWDGKLNACELDMDAMALLAADCGFSSLGNLATSGATRQVVLERIGEAATRLKSGDILMVTYSGHGGQVPDFQEREDSGNDETWCLYDGQLLDDELLLSWRAFVDGVRILIVSDSCHSGGMEKFSLNGSFVHAIGGPLIRQAPATALQKTYFANSEFYENLQDGVRREVGQAPEESIEQSLQCSALLMAACQDFELSYEGAFGGYFTSALISVWNFGKFSGNYGDMRKQIAAQFPPNQSPQIKHFGKTIPSFALETPFSA